MINITNTAFQNEEKKRRDERNIEIVLKALKEILPIKAHAQKP